MKKTLAILFFLASSVLAETYSTGLIFDDEAYEKTAVTATLMSRDINGLPSSISLEPYAPKVGNQGKTGTCTAWSTAYGARTILESIALNRLDKKETTKNVFSPSYVYNQIRLQKGCKNGTYIHHALELMKNEGVAKFKDFTFDCNKQVTSSIRRLSSAYKIQDYKRLFTLNPRNKIQSIKKALSEKKPVLIGMSTPKSFSKRNESVWSPKAIDYQASKLGGHAMVVVGYDDAKHGGSFRLMNSWGERWGDEGFKWIRYDDFDHFVKYAYELIPKVNPNKRIKMGGKLKFVNENRTPMNATYDSYKNMYVMNRPYYSGTRFYFEMTNNEPIYLYAFGFDNTENTFTIFPYNSYVSAYQGYKNSTVAFPSENHYVKLDNTKGKDYFVVLYSKFPLQIDTIKKLIEVNQGTLKKRLQYILGNKLIHQNIHFSQQHIDFNYGGNKILDSSQKSSIIALIVEFEHK